MKKKKKKQIDLMQNDILLGNKVGMIELKPTEIFFRTGIQ